MTYSHVLIQFQRLKRSIYPSRHKLLGIGHKVINQVAVGERQFGVGKRVFRIDSDRLLEEFDGFLTVFRTCLIMIVAAQYQQLVSFREEHTSELQSPCNLVCRLLLGKKNRLSQ